MVKKKVWNKWAITFTRFSIQILKIEFCDSLFDIIRIEILVNRNLTIYDLQISQEKETKTWKDLLYILSLRVSFVFIIFDILRWNTNHIRGRRCSDNPLKLLS